MSIRPALPADHAAVRGVVAGAFESQAEADLVEAIRSDGAAVVELVAEDAGEVIGHILFSPLDTDTGQRFAALAPLAVKPGLQNGGVGSALSIAGVEACRGLGFEALVVLGHPDYYPRFGFSAQAAATVQSVYAGRASFMAMALVPGALDGPVAVTYHPAFG